MSDLDVAGFLATVPLFEDWGRDERDEVAGVLRRRSARDGDVLWRQGDAARDMLFVVSGGLSVSLLVPGDRSVEIERAGPGGMVGEIALLDGGAHTTTVAATADAVLLVLGRRDLLALLSRPHPSAFGLKRRFARLFAARLRGQLAHLASPFGDAVSGPPAAAPERPVAALEECPPPDSRYMRRMATFHDFDRLAVWGFLTSGTYARCAPGVELLAEGTPSPACYLTINGAVEKVMVRGDRRVRVGLAGPGRAFGYVGLIDGGPSPMTAIARERSLLLILPRDAFAKLFGAEDPISRVFLDVIQRDLVGALRQTLSPLARLVASRPS